MTTDPPRFRLRQSPEYEVKRATLDENQLRQVARAEERIAEDPDDPADRYPAEDGGQIDFSPVNAGVFIKFCRDTRSGHADEVELQDLLIRHDKTPVRRWPLDED